MERADGAMYPFWSPDSVSLGFFAEGKLNDGKKLFFISDDKTMMSVGFDPETGIVGTPKPLFKTRIIAKSFVGTQYDVAPDGRFTIHSLPADSASPLTVLADWTTGSRGEKSYRAN